MSGKGKKNITRRVGKLPPRITQRVGKLPPRSPGIHGIWSEPGRPLTPIGNVTHAKTMFGPAAHIWRVAHSRKNSEGKDVLKPARGLFESTSPEKQCNDVLGSADEKNPPVCYLCGFQTVIDGDRQLRPSCDHILPISQASAMGYLYDPLRHSETIKQPAGKEHFQLAYKWTHIACNLVRNQTPLIQYNEPTFSAYDDGINKIINQIFDKDVIHKIILKNKTEQTWKKDRFRVIKASISGLVARLNSVAPAPGLVLLGAVASAEGAPLPLVGNEGALPVPPPPVPPAPVPPAPVPPPPVPPNSTARPLTKEEEDALEALLQGQRYRSSRRPGMRRKLLPTRRIGGGSLPKLL